MERGTQYRNKPFRKPWRGHRITYSSSSTCCGLGILYPSWSKLTIFLPSIRGYGEPPKKEKVTSCYNTLLHGMISLKIWCCRCCCFYSKCKELTVSGCMDNLLTHLPLYLPLALRELKKPVNLSYGVGTCCDKVTVLNRQLCSGRQLSPWTSNISTGFSTSQSFTQRVNKTRVKGVFEWTIGSISR